MQKRQIRRVVIQGIKNQENVRKLIAQKVFVKQRKILVLVNPFGGAGAAPGNWAIAQRMFNLASQRV